MFQPLRHTRDKFFLPNGYFKQIHFQAGCGGGFYDRYLAAHPAHPTLALCYAFQLLPRLETESFDVPVQYVLSAEIREDVQ